MSPSSSLHFLNNTSSSVELNDDWADEPSYKLQDIKNSGGFPSLVSLTIPVGSQTLKAFFAYLSLCPNLRELTVTPREFDEIYEYTLAPTDAWAWGALELVPHLNRVAAPALLIDRLVRGRAVHTVGIIQAERADSDAMLRHNRDALRAAAHSGTVPVERLVLEDISVPFMRPLLRAVAETFPMLKTLRMRTDAMDELNDPDEKYQYGNIPDETYEAVLADVVQGVIRLPETLNVLELTHQSAFMLDYDPVSYHGIDKDAFPNLCEIMVGVDGQRKRLEWSDELLAWMWDNIFF